MHTGQRYKNSEVSKELIYRHFAWLTALRYSMREGRNWEAQTQVHNQEFQEKYYKIPEKESTLEQELSKYISSDEVKYILSTKNKAAQLLSLQGKIITEGYKNGKISTYEFVEMEKAIKDLYDQQGKSERIKNFPYPRQFAALPKKEKLEKFIVWGKVKILHVVEQPKVLWENCSKMKL